MSNTLGWDAIENHLVKIYPNQDPKHWATVIRYADGGPDPLDGISAYRIESPSHWHWIGFGLTELGPKVTEDKEVSGWGVEVGIRIPCPKSWVSPPEWPIQFLQKLARYVFNTGNPFGSEHFIQWGKELPADTSTKLCSVIFISDPILKGIETPNGEVQFLTAIGITEDEHRFASDEGPERLLPLLLENNPLGLTDVNRQSVLRER